MNDSLRQVFSSAGWMIRDDDQAEEHVAQARRMVETGAGTSTQLALASAIVAAADEEDTAPREAEIEMDPGPRESQPTAKVKADDAYFSSLWALAQEVTTAKGKLGGERVDEILRYCHQNRVDPSACLRAEIERVEAIPDKKTVRAPSWGNTR